MIMKGIRFPEYHDEEYHQKSLQEKQTHGKLGR